MTFQRIIAGLLILVIAGLAGAFYMNWKTGDPVADDEGIRRRLCVCGSRCGLRRVQSTTPFKWNTGTRTAVVGLNSVKLDKYTVIASYTLVADGVYCDYDPIKKKADIGSSFLERE